jgi:hypothetical protein
MGLLGWGRDVLSSFVLEQAVTVHQAFSVRPLVGGAIGLDKLTFPMHLAIIPSTLVPCELREEGPVHGHKIFHEKKDENPDTNMFSALRD